MKTVESAVILEASVSYLSTVVDVPASPRSCQSVDEKCRWLCIKSEGNRAHHLRPDKADQIITCFLGLQSCPVVGVNL